MAFRSRPANSPGYEQTGKEKFDYKVTFRVDYSDYDLKAKDVNEILSEQIYNMKAFYKSIGTQTTGTKSKLFFMEITPQAEKALSKSRNRSVTIQTLPDGYNMSVALKPELAKLGEEGKGIMSKYVNRIETGRMKREIRYATRERGKYSTLEVGWIRTWFKYFGFQEGGFFNVWSGKFVPPMRSVLRTSLEFSPIAQTRLTQFVRKYLRAR